MKINHILIYVIFFMLGFNIIIPILTRKDIVVSAGPSDDFDYYVVFTIDKDFIDTTLTNFPVLVTINSSIGNKCNGGNSIRFYNTDNSTEYNFDFDFWGGGSEDSFIWVKIPVIFSSVDTKFLMYYGNSSATKKSSAFRQATW